MSTALFPSALALAVASDRRLSLLRPSYLTPRHHTQPRHGEAAASDQITSGGSFFQRRCPPVHLTRCSTSEAAPGGQNDAGGSDSEEPTAKVGFWSKWKGDTADMRSKLAKLGLAAVLAYGLFDGVTYTTFFVLAFFGYEKSTGKNPAANLQALLGIIILMWTGNNVTRPFRVAGAAALAPAVDEGLKMIQKHLRLRNQVYAFAFVVGVVAATCLSIVGVLILSRWGK